MNRLRKLREKKKFKAQYIADILHVSLRTYYNIENELSALTTEMIEQLSKIYNVTADYLLGIVDFNLKESREESDKLLLMDTLSDLFK